MTPDKFQEFATRTAENSGATPEEAAQYGAAQAAAFKNDDPATMRSNSQQLFQTQRERQEQSDIDQLMQNLRTARGPATPVSTPVHTPAAHTPEPQAGPKVTKYLTDIGAPNAAGMTPDKFQE